MKIYFILVNKPILFLLPLFILLSSFNFKNSADSGLFPDDNFQIRETRTIRNFNKLDLKINATIYLQQGNLPGVIVVAPEGQIARVKTRVSGHTLVIDKYRSLNSKQEIKIYVTVPDLKKISLFGAGKIIGAGILEADFLDLTVAGSGAIDLEVEANAIKSNVLGSGSITLTGRSDSHEAIILGSGKVHASSLKTSDTIATILGSGKAFVAANTFLDVRIIGSGKLEYTGQPEVEQEVYSFKQENKL